MRDLFMDEFAVSLLVQELGLIIYQFTQQNLPACKPVLSPVWIPKLMKAPIYIYYQLDNYYQNHRRPYGDTTNLSWNWKPMSG
ncbi:UNVERIFIED_CONTAM: putative ALA-interacting subunit [Sesamum radiatum]|uniref:ALA-interacting subunit n=1 Tax=Sesamum radiatum TaxID=300843 RepID=A0AAW2K2U7_SESRA